MQAFPTTLHFLFYIHMITVLEDTFTMRYRTKWWWGDGIFFHTYVQYSRLQCILVFVVGRKFICTWCSPQELVDIFQKYFSSLCCTHYCTVDWRACKYKTVGGNFVVLSYCNYCTYLQFKPYKKTTCYLRPKISLHQVRLCSCLSKL